MLNRELFVKDPVTTNIPNLGVAKVREPEKPEEWNVLRWELSSFVCEGEYEQGLVRILEAYLSHLDKPEQPAVWVSGFYGTGKSHLVRVLNYLWRDVAFSDGATARGLASLPENLKALFIELTTAGKRAGGLWSAGGTLSATAGDRVRLAVLGILLRSAVLPTDYATARFVLWLMKEGFYGQVRERIEAQGESLVDELANFFVSPVLAKALLEVHPGFASNEAEAHKLLAQQFPDRDDITDDDFLELMEDVLLLKTTTPGKLPLTLLVLDELQQFVGEDNNRSLQVQSLVETCSSRFGSNLLFVGTGQTAMLPGTQLGKLQGRFRVRATLTDSDVHKVLRNVILQKRPDRVADLKGTLQEVSGEIDSHLLASSIGASPSDAPCLVADYPLLPVRRRFWERLLRAVDPSGTAGQLRTQLMIVHSANRQVATKPVGWVIPADAIYKQLEGDMLQSTALPRDVSEVINRLDDGMPDGVLRSRLCALAFLIGKLPSEGPLAAGIRCTADTLADLMVEDLGEGSASLRQAIPVQLVELVSRGALMLVNGEYRIQTRESAEWEADYRQRLARIMSDDARIASDRSTELRRAADAALKGTTLVHGASRTARKYHLSYGVERPTLDTDSIPVWIRDEWSVSERTVRQDARDVGAESPMVFVFVPKRDGDAIRQALASYAAAQETVQSRPAPEGAPGKQARMAMQSRAQMEKDRLDGLVPRLLAAARVFQGGGNEVEGGFAEAIKVALEASLVRLFPKFEVADHAAWDSVFRRASEGSGDPLTAVGHRADAEAHPVCSEILAYIGPEGKPGKDVRAKFIGSPYGWPQDAIDAALCTLIGAGLAKAVRNGEAVSVKSLRRPDIGTSVFSREGVSVTAEQRFEVKKLLHEVGIILKAGEEAWAIERYLDYLKETALGAGGAPPLPAPPTADEIYELKALAGNQQLVTLYGARENLRASLAQWQTTKADIDTRLPRWELLNQLLSHASSLDALESVRGQVEAIADSRSLLDDPDPVKPLSTTLESALRAALKDRVAALADARSKGLAELEASDLWLPLGEGDRKRLLAKYELAVQPQTHAGDAAALLRTLSDTPLRTWDIKAAAVPGHVSEILREAATILEPKAVHVSLPQATLKTEKDVEGYLATLRSKLVGVIGKGNPAIVGR